jgi:hypothetical protein
MVDQRVRQRNAAGAFGDQAADGDTLLALPGPIDRQEYVGLVLEPAIEGLGSEARAPGDLVAVGAREATLHEFLLRRGDETGSRGGNGGRQFHPGIIGLTRRDFQITL